VGRRDVVDPKMDTVAGSLLVLATEVRRKERRAGMRLIIGDVVASRGTWACESGTGARSSRASGAIRGMMVCT
jgi:hypothetical protein